MSGVARPTTEGREEGVRLPVRASCAQSRARVAAVASISATRRGSTRVQAACCGAGVQGNPVLPPQLRARVEGPAPSSPALGRLGRGAPQGAKSSGACALLAESLAQPQRDLGLGRRGRILADEWVYKVWGEPWSTGACK